MKKKWFVLLLLVSAGMFFLASCASTAPVQESAAEPAPEISFFAEPKRVLMMGDTMCLNMATPEGWQLDYDFAQWAGYDTGFLPVDAYGPEGISIQYYILGFIEEGDPESYADFVEIDRQNYIWQGYDVDYRDIAFTPDDTTGMLDYGMCEMYGLPGSALEMMFIIETEKANAVLVYAAKGDASAEDIERTKKGFLELCRSAVINAPITFGF